MIQGALPAARLPRRPDADTAALLRLVGGLRARLGGERLLRLALRAASVSLGVVAVAHLVAWLLDVDVPAAATLAVLLAPALLALAFGLATWPSAQRAAREADRRLGLEERLGTALELAQAPSLASPRFARLQVVDALASATAARGRWPSPLAQVRPETLATAGLAGLALGAVLLAALRDRLPIEPPALALPTVPFAAPAQPAGGLPAPPPLLAVDKPVLVRPVVEHAPPPAPPNRLPANPQQADLSRLAEALGQVSAARGAAERIEQGDLAGAGSQLTDLAENADQLSQAAKDQLAQALQAAAGASRASDPALAERTRRAAEALRGSSYENQREALRTLGQEVTRRAPGQQPGPPPQAPSSVQPGQSGQPPTEPQQSGAGAPGAGSGSGVGPGSRLGSGYGPGQAPAGGPNAAQPGERSYTPGEQAPRLADAGEEVPVPLQMGGSPGGRAPARPDQDTLREDGTATIVAADVPTTQDPGRLAPEQNSVPGDRRQAVRDYFSGE